MKLLLESAIEATAGSAFLMLLLIQIPDEYALNARTTGRLPGHWKNILS
jgi:hypothetical protein